MLPQVVEEIDSAATTLVFTNTRSQSEIWYQALLDARPDWAGLIALHHGSLHARCATGSNWASSRARSRPWSAPPAWIWAWTSCRSSGLQIGSPKAWRG